MNEIQDDMGIDIETFSIEEELKKHDDEDIPGWHVFLRLYIRPNRTKGGLIITDKTHDDQIYESCIGLVVAISPGAYTDSRYEKTGAWCKKGEWRTFPRHAGYRQFLNGIPYWYLPEDAIGKREKDPRIVSRDKPTANRNL